MKTLVAAAFALGLLGTGTVLTAPAANAAVHIGINVHPVRHHYRPHHRHQVCSWRHHHRVCSWR